MDIRVTFPGGKRVDADLGSHVVRTDQSVAGGGGGTAPEPFQLFLASLATCAGIYALGFCEARGISTQGLELVQRHAFDERTHRLERIELHITLPPNFPGRHLAGLENAVAACRVKKTLVSPPEILVAIEQEAPAQPA